MTTYKSSGVNIGAAESMLARIRKDVRSTFTRGVLTDIGLFGAMYDARFTGMNSPVLVSSVDGVGTKVKIAQMTGVHHTVGHDLVNHSVNDILTTGARPLFFMDYFATGKLRPSVGADVVKGFVNGCKENGCALIGGETAEMPGMYKPGEYDLAGMVVGVVDRKKIVKTRTIKRGDIMIALPSNGLHTNGYSLARKALLKRIQLYSYVEELNCSLAESLLRIHRSYLREVQPLLAKNLVRGISHITGGGIVGNTIRILPKGLTLAVDWKGWERPPLFQLIQKLGRVPEQDMRRTFNLGVGLILIVSKLNAERVLTILKTKGVGGFPVGEIIRKKR